MWLILHVAQILVPRLQPWNALHLEAPASARNPGRPEPNGMNLVSGKALAAGRYNRRLASCHSLIDRTFIPIVRHQSVKTKTASGKNPGSREVLSYSEEVTEQEAVLSHLRST